MSAEGEKNSSISQGSHVQLPLNMTPRLPYTPEGFLLHDGVRSIVELFERSIADAGFRIFFIAGGQRLGKTHLSIRLFDSATKSGVYPKLIDGRDLAGRITEITDADPVIIIDDAQEYFKGIEPGMSGPFVTLVEMLRVSEAKLVLLSATDVDELPCDEHVKSRLRPGQGMTIEPPTEMSLVPLIHLMAKQRGLKLTDRKVNYLLRRLSQDIRGIEDYLDRVNYLSSLFGRQVKMPLLADAL